MKKESDADILRKQIEGELMGLRAGMAWRESIIRELRALGKGVGKRVVSPAFRAAARKNIKKANAARMKKLRKKEVA